MEVDQSVFNCRGSWFVSHFRFHIFSADGDPPDDAGLGQGDRDLGGQVRGPQDRQGLSSTGDKLMRFITG